MGHYNKSLQAGLIFYTSPNISHTSSQSWTRNDSRTSLDIAYQQGTLSQLQPDKRGAYEDHQHSSILWIHCPFQRRAYLSLHIAWSTLVDYTSYIWKEQKAR